MPKHITPIAESNHFIILDQYSREWEPVATPSPKACPAKLNFGKSNMSTIGSCC